MKKLVQSKTFWLAIAQAVACIVVAVQTEFPEIGYIGTIKSFIDIFLRMNTDKGIA